MHIVVVGVDHTTAPIALRERLACSLPHIPEILRATKQVAQECVLLSTCNRVELYAARAEIDDARANLLHVLSEMCRVALPEIEAHSYYFADEQAVVHLFGVACGLYSLVPGEVQIQGQVAEALELAQNAGYAGPLTSALFRAALVAGKRARSETGFSRNAASVSHAAVLLARQFFPRLNTACILLIGSGRMSELTAHHLCDSGAKRLIVINRTQSHAIDLVQRFGAEYRSFGELLPSLVEADVVISSTTAPHAVLSVELVQEVMRQRIDRSLLLIDIALPRDVDPAAAALPGVHLYNLDDLRTVVNEGISLRMLEAEHVQSIIAEEVSTFERWLRSLSVAGTIGELRQYADALRQQELARTMRQLSGVLTEREAAAVQELTTRLVNKLLHTPMLRLKDAAAAGQGHIYAGALRYLFDLEEQEDKDNKDDRDNEEQYDSSVNTIAYWSGPFS